MLDISLLASVLALILVWFTAEMVLGFYIYPVALDVYALLSTEFEAIDVVKRKITNSNSIHMERLLNSIPLKITRIKRGWSRDRAFEAMIYTVILYLCKNKMAETMDFPFAEDEESLRHPIMRSLTPKDFEKYREREKELQAIVDVITQMPDKHPKKDSEDMKSMREDFERFREEARENLEAYIFCVKKLPFTRRPKRRVARIVTSPSEVTARM
jgi:hypothetical protein